MDTSETGKVLFYPPKTNRFQFESPKCAFCKQNVYAAEEVSAAGKKYHKLCCKCTHCGKLLNSQNLTEHDEMLYCKSCYSKSFGPKGYGHGVGAGILSMDGTKTQSFTSPITSQSNSASSSPPTTRHENDDFRVANSLNNNEPQLFNMNSHSLNSNGNRAPSLQTQPSSSFSSLHKRTICHRCAKTVYLAEEVKAAGESFHKLCFTCKMCNKGLNGARYNDREQEIYCQSCYQKNWGPRGVGFGVGAGVLSTNGD
ncbi:unnamed protein product [Didymodactylos carnosus]|uniref:LIM zinc-binding domain-containing protein n=1 Tax=Didymodactylos carnosus TaxID=1234261 RepID=A0A814QD76_9BILA|nr:unnamed protein product [Didymodactylos carnosus]CAF1117046.1 unnamed protein product [Didymodactylos carnosus]CAF3816894.1 unnamed protein product [Didymodactylos carnosus]CAF3880895.1 unnamed protein product [Didymodactylos carnosus]